jgi:hypothetical protein
MNAQNISVELRGLGLTLSGEQILAMQQQHEAGVLAAKERFASWGAWEQIATKDIGRPFDVFQNNEYTVGVTEVDTCSEYFGVVTYLVCVRCDGEPVHSWLDLQQIKNTIVGEEEIAVEVFPPDSHLFDGVNAYHLWVLPARGDDFPLDLMVLNERRSVQPARYKSQRQIERQLARARR